MDHESRRQDRNAHHSSDLIFNEVTSAKLLPRLKCKIQIKQNLGNDTMMKLTQHEEAMLAGEMGAARQWALEHQVQVGRMFDAQDMVQVSQAHMMADPESTGVAGVEFLTIERRLIAACKKLGIMMTNTCINYQTIMAPVLGAHVAYGDTGVVIYSNSACGARSNFEGGPSALAAGLTGRTPRYGLHLDRHRRATRRYTVTTPLTGLTDWGVLGAVIGRKAGSYWEVPVIEGIEQVPTSDEIKHMGAAMASYGSIPLFHIVGITPECHTLSDVDGENLKAEKITQADIEELCAPFGASGEKVDVVVFAAPQLSLVEMQQVANLCRGRKIHRHTALLVCTPSSVYVDSETMGYNEAIERFGGKVLQGTCFYQQYAREIGEANGWKRLLSNSAKIVNILGGYGYQPALASMEDCIASAAAGEIVKCLN